MAIVLISFCALVVGILLGMFIATSRADRKTRLSKTERRELESLRQLVYVLDDTAHEHRELEPALSVIIIDEIRKRRRELNK